MTISSYAKFSSRIVCAMGALACSDGGDSHEAVKNVDAGSTVDGGDTASREPRSGVFREGDQMIFRTEEFTLEPFDERYLCWTSPKLDESFKTTTFEYPGQRVVHHFLFYKVTSGDETPGFRECDEDGFKFTWTPLFGAGAGASHLAFPDGLAQQIEAGTQLVVSLHLFNPRDETVTAAAEVSMTRTDDPDTTPVQMGILGTPEISLPPGVRTDIVSECTTVADVRVVGLWPHMHMLAKGMKLEIGSTKETASTFFERSPYDFEDQRVEILDKMIPRGAYAGLTCSYQNDTSNTVTYGESSLDEMCFLLVFMTGTGPRGTGAPSAGGPCVPMLPPGFEPPMNQ